MKSLVKKLVAFSFIIIVLAIWPVKSEISNDYFTEVTYKKFNFTHKRYYNKKGRFIFSYTDFFKTESGKSLYLLPQFDPLGGSSPLIELIDYSGVKSQKVSFHVGSKEYNKIIDGDNN